MQNYDFKSITLTGDGVAYQCTDNGAPERPDDYDPEVLYFSEYRKSIIINTSVTNNNIHPVAISIKLTKDTGDKIYIIKDTPLNPSSTIAPIGEDQRLVLDHLDIISLEIKSIGATIDADLVDTVISIMQIYDWGHIPPISPPLIWYGDIGFAGGGETNNSVIDKIDFLTSTWSTNYTSTNASNYSRRGSASNSVIGLLATGSYLYLNHIDSISISSETEIINYSSLYTDAEYIYGNSDGFITLWGGGLYYDNGYHHHDIIQKSLFDSGDVSTLWGNLYNNDGVESLGTVGNNIYSIWYGGYSTNSGYLSLIQYVEYKTEGQAQQWGSLWRGTQFSGKGGSNKIMGIMFGDSHNYYADVHKIEFASQGDSINFGTMGSSGSGFTYMYEPGAIWNENKIFFFGDERYSNDIVSVDFAADYQEAYFGNCTWWDGGCPWGVSGR